MEARKIHDREREREWLPAAAAGRRSFVAYSSESEIHMMCVRTLERE